jgi:hypothetical protein
MLPTTTVETNIYTIPHTDLLILTPLEVKHFADILIEQKTPANKIKQIIQTFDYLKYEKEFDNDLSLLKQATIKTESYFKVFEYEKIITFYKLPENDNYETYSSIKLIIRKITESKKIIPNHQQSLIFKLIDLKNTIKQKNSLGFHIMKQIDKILFTNLTESEVNLKIKELNDYKTLIKNIPLGLITFENKEKLLEYCNRHYRSESCFYHNNK